MTGILKYVPQVMLNVRRRSTKGWTIWNVILDLTGGLLSVVQVGTYMRPIFVVDLSFSVQDARHNSTYFTYIQVCALVEYASVDILT